MFQHANHYRLGQAAACAYRMNTGGFKHSSICRALNGWFPDCSPSPHGVWRPAHIDFIVEATLRWGPVPSVAPRGFDLDDIIENHGLIMADQADCYMHEYQIPGLNAAQA